MEGQSPKRPGAAMTLLQKLHCAGVPKIVMLILLYKQWAGEDLKDFMWLAS